MYLLRQVATPSSSELAAATTADRLRPMQGMIKPARSSSAQQERSKLLRERRRTDALSSDRPLFFLQTFRLLLKHTASTLQLVTYRQLVW